jgi:hypothetical protein
LNEIRIHQDDSKRRLAAVEFQQLTAMPAAADWFANIDNPRSRRAVPCLSKRPGRLLQFCRAGYRR